MLIAQFAMVDCLLQFFFCNNKYVFIKMIIFKEFILQCALTPLIVVIRYGKITPTLSTFTTLKHSLCAYTHIM